METLVTVPTVSAITDNTVQPSAETLAAVPAPAPDTAPVPAGIDLEAQGVKTLLTDDAPILTWELFVKITQEPQSLRAYLITPVVAERILKERDKRNRKRDKKHAAFIAEEMLAGDWKFTGDPIRFDTDGWLSDGGHRLEAIVKTGIGVIMLVLTQFDRTAQIALDCGRKNRKGADAFTLEGLCADSDSASISAAIVEIMRAEHKRTGKKKSLTITPRKEVAYFQANQADLMRALGAAREIIEKHPTNEKAKKTQPFFKDSELTSLIFMAVRLNEPEDTVIDFFNRFLDGEADESAGETFPPYQAFLALSNEGEDDTRTNQVKKPYRNSLLSEAYHLFKNKKIAKLKTKQFGKSLCEWPMPLDRKRLEGVKKDEKPPGRKPKEAAATQIADSIAA